VVIIMAVVPKTATMKGGITAFICPNDAPGVVIETRNAFMGLRGIENSVTRLEDVFVPSEAVVGRRRQGPQACARHAQHGAPVAAGDRRGLDEVRAQDLPRVGQRAQAVGHADRQARSRRAEPGVRDRHRLRLEAVVDVSSRLADDKRNDFRVEAALAKLYASEMGWQAVDAMIQIRGGRGYETAQSLKDRGEKPVPAEQLLRDMRINRIFEGSTEIMHLLIAREALDQHLEVAGDILDPKTSAADKARSAVGAAKFYAGYLPTLVSGEGQKPKHTSRSSGARTAPALRRAPLAQARALDDGPHGPPPGVAGEEGRAARPRRRHRIRSSTRSPARSSTPRRSRSGTPRGARRPSSWPTCSPPRPRGAPS
jgi:hypothetical protein